MEGDNPKISGNRSSAKAKRRHTGAQAKASGESFEAIVERVATTLIDRGVIVDLNHVPPPMRSVYGAVGGKPRVVFIPKDSAPCDYSFATAEGRYGVFDAKSTENKRDRYNWHTDSRHQVDQMVRVAKAPLALAFALINWKQHGEVRLHPVETFDGYSMTRQDGYIVSENGSLSATMFGSAIEKLA